MSEENWTTVIKPKNKLLEVNIRELWDYRDLISLFIKRNIITQYKQTILGPLWFIVQPALTVIMYMIVFGGIAGIPTDGCQGRCSIWRVLACGTISQSV